MMAEVGVIAELNEENCCHIHIILSHLFALDSQAY